MLPLLQASRCPVPPLHFSTAPQTVLPLGVCNPGASILPCFQAGIGSIPLLGPMYLRCAGSKGALERVNNVGGEHAILDSGIVAGANLTSTDVPCAVLLRMRTDSLATQPPSLTPALMVPASPPPPSTFPPPTATSRRRQLLRAWRRCDVRAGRNGGVPLTSGGGGGCPAPGWRGSWPGESHRGRFD